MKILALFGFLLSIANATEMKFRFSDTVIIIGKDQTDTEKFYKCNSHKYKVVDFKVIDGKDITYKIYTGEIRTGNCDGWYNETLLKKVK